MNYIVTVTYRKEDTLLTAKEAEQCEADLWRMLQRVYGMKPLKMEVEVIK